MAVGLFYVTAFVGVIAPDNLAIIAMTGAGDLENLNHIVNGTLLLTIGLLSASRRSLRRDSTVWT